MWALYETCCYVLSLQRHSCYYLATMTQEQTTSHSVPSHVPVGCYSDVLMGIHCMTEQLWHRRQTGKKAGQEQSTATSHALQLMLWYWVQP
jgi:hypothetical protein